MVSSLITPAILILFVVLVGATLHNNVLDRVSYDHENKLPKWFFHGSIVYIIAVVIPVSFTEFRDRVGAALDTIN